MIRWLTAIIVILTLSFILNHLTENNIGVFGWILICTATFYFGINILAKFLSKSQNPQIIEGLLSVQNELPKQPVKVGKAYQSPNKGNVVLVNDIGQKVAMDQRRQTKALNTLMGIVSGAICDDRLHDNEIIYLSTWINENEHVAYSYPGNIIFKKVREVLNDGVITQEERDHLLNELKILSGNDFSNTGSALPEYISTLFDKDPNIIIPGKYFVFTGDFLYGTRESCHRAIESRGGIFRTSVSKKTNYLVVGSRTSPDWITENFGRKIQKAAMMIESGDLQISIVSEADWVKAI